MASGGITHFVNKVKSTAISLAGEVQPVLKVSAAFVLSKSSSICRLPTTDTFLDIILNDCIGFPCSLSVSSVAVVIKFYLL